MKLLIYAVGRLKESFYTQAQAEYVKRLSRFADTRIIEVPEEKPFGKSDPDRIAAVAEEGKRLIRVGAGADYKAALSPEGRKTDSLQFASMLAEIALKGKNTVGFFIGGSYGLSDELKNHCDSVVSFSDMTFNHQLFRIMLLEQVYRSFKINANETYHK